MPGDGVEWGAVNELVQTPELPLSFRLNVRQRVGSSLLHSPLLRALDQVAEMQSRPSF